ncbi:porin family protein [Sphingobacterium sp. UT-1RO-CII-1]|uniref:outer membrane beta-barrel protein n=1 Tax=Sphingobacterium sp. UT-1RO-CII-1 TaxID=2995225 RepID=UPI00227A5C3E|nr:outer membrane beta-barrel protein [Sphingobacterium sp. UT-1RO-CII-1]MCY4781062.1 porin family protein [Sphingobacterium sp. UT-1RO-CII-1]
MKNIFLSIAALLVLGTTTVSAQGFKGKWFILGEASYGTKSDGDIKNYSILPVVGTFVAPTTAVGLGIGYLGSKNETDATLTLKEGTFIVQPLARKYWAVTDNFLIFGQAAVPLAFGKNTTEPTNGTKTETKYTGYGFEISPGIDYFLSKNFSIEASFGIASWSSVKPKGGDASNDFNFGLNSGFLNGMKFGLKYVF